MRSPLIMNELKVINVKNAIGKVARIIDDYSCVINKGANDGLEQGKEFFIIELGEVIVDPDTNEELEQLHIVKGSARIETIQERIATLRTSEERVLRAAVKRRKNASDIRSIFAGLNEYEIVEPAVTEPKKFLNLKVGDLIIPKNN
jgi:hypothetical protein